MCLWPPPFYHFPLMPFIISRSFTYLVLFLSAPLGTPNFLFSCVPFVCHIYCISPTRNAGSSLSLGNASFGLRKSLPSCVPVVAFLWGQAPLASTTAYQPFSAALWFVQQLFGSQCSTVFSTLLTQCCKTALTCKKTDGWSRDFYFLFFVTPKTQNSRNFGGYCILLQQEKSLNA